MMKLDAALSSFANVAKNVKNIITLKDKRLLLLTTI
jgi:hypothetical protein